MKNILISSAGQRVVLVQIFQNTLKELGIDSKVYASDMQPDLAPACYTADECFKVPRCNDESYIDVLLKHCVEKNIGLIIPTIDPELLVFAANVKRFKEVLEKEGVAVTIRRTLGNDIDAACGQLRAKERQEETR